MDSHLPKITLFLAVASTNILLVFLLKYGVELLTSSDEEAVKDDLVVVASLLSVYFILFTLALVALAVVVLATPQGRAASKVFALVHS